MRRLGSMVTPSQGFIRAYEIDAKLGSRTEAKDKIDRVVREVCQTVSSDTNLFQGADEVASLLEEKYGARR